mmetsp:Transcript_57103/g.133137  ORF Transcript_57103/g.133137 Transcript_57103/m.133137 type:complete len:217 (-) Transcript_57103:80-730(-)|eukprot:CAMPEP_0171082930 /NCGR_PEP_ID=MMETSP0766_2-20121228/17408_1 /TAXON_ID=439317 /ORGANISM="Gambierdiscus australes, Strain CAWD 149" /LENGTH=216 /DNA_ID=CAMNT_0011540331 /DNA_START=64 /DNA_END=714 /DNA_ORIENTATION=+
MAAIATQCSGYISATVQGPVKDQAIGKVKEEAIDFWPYCSAKQITVEDPGSTAFRTAFTKALVKLKEKYANLEPEFEDDDMTGLLTREERQQGWSFPLTRTMQKKEFGAVVCEQERFLAHLQDGHLNVVREYLNNSKRKHAIDVNLFDRSGLTPLHHAALLNHLDIAQALLEADADPTLRDRENNLTPLAMAQRGSPTVGPSDSVMEALQAFGVRK